METRLTFLPESVLELRIQKYTKPKESMTPAWKGIVPLEHFGHRFNLHAKE